MKPGAGTIGLVWLLVTACAESGERAPARAPSSTRAEEAPARPIATSLSSDPLHEPTPAQQPSEHHPGMHDHMHDHNAAEAASGAQGQPAIYSCPMHPEVQQPGPGECPKCGMKLVPSAPAKPAPQSAPEAQPAHEHAN